MRRAKMRQNEHNQSSQKNAPLTLRDCQSFDRWDTVRDCLISEIINPTLIQLQLDFYDITAPCAKSGAPLTDITFRLSTQFNIHQLSKQAVYL